MRNILIITILIFLTGCKATAEQKKLRAERKAERIAKRATADSLFLAQQKEYMLEQQGQNFPESQDQDHNNNE